MSNKTVKEKTIVKKKNKLLKHLLSTKGGGGKPIPNWMVYLYFIIFIILILISTH